MKVSTRLQTVPFSHWATALTYDFIVPVYTTRYYERYESVHKIVHFGYAVIFD